MCAPASKFWFRSAEETATPIAALEILAELIRDIQRRVQSALSKTQMLAVFAGNSRFPCFLACRQTAGLQLLGMEWSTAWIEPSIAQLCLRDVVQCGGHHLRYLPYYTIWFRLKRSAVDTAAG